MKYIITIATILLFGCATPVQKHNTVTFYDSHGKIYHINTASAALEKEYKLAKKPGIILVATLDDTQPNYQEQIQILDTIDAEALQFLYINANATHFDKSGYYTTNETAAKLLGDDAFKIIVYNRVGTPVTSSTQVLSKDAIIRLLP